MKVSKENSLEQKLLNRINQINGDVVLRSEIEDLSDFRQLSRALKTLVDEGMLARISFGVYAKTERSAYTGNIILKEPFDVVVKEALDKMGVQWTLTEPQKAYNDRKSTQIPARPAVRLKSRCRRVFAFQNATLNYEGNIYAR